MLLGDLNIVHVQPFPRFFITSQFIFGFYAGSFIGFILLNIGSSWSYYVNFSLTAVCGLVGAALATVLWLLLAVPVLSVFLPTLEVRETS